MNESNITLVAFSDPLKKLESCAPNFRDSSGLGETHPLRNINHMIFVNLSVLSVSTSRQESHNSSVARFKSLVVLNDKTSAFESENISGTLGSWVATLSLTNVSSVHSSGHNFNEDFIFVANWKR